jgi:acyl carrier protein
MSVQIQASDTLVHELSRFVADAFLNGDRDALTPEAPLLEWGVLTSMNTAHLLTHIRERYGVDVPPQAITATHLRDIASISALVRDLRANAT